MRAAVYVYDANGGNGRLFARGIRNAEGLAWAQGTAPGTRLVLGTCWGGENQKWAAQ